MSQKNMDKSSLLNLQAEYILNEIKAAEGNNIGGLYSLIIDDKVESILFRVLTKDQLLRIVTSIEKIDEKRKQSPFLQAIYLVDMTVFNLKCIIADVQTNRYKNGIGLFIPTYDNNTLNFFNSSRFLSNPKINQYLIDIKNCYIDLYPQESKVFLTDNFTPNSMPIYYNENCSEFVLTQIKLAAKSLVNLMIITGEYPLIRFYSPNNHLNHHPYTASRLSELIADEFQQQIDNYAREHLDFPPPSENKPRSILLIVDRTIDLYAPLLHEFTYQAMAMDIVPSLERKGVYEYNFETETGEINKTTALLENENDPTWISLRHYHIIESSEIMIKIFNDFVQNNQLLVDRSKVTTTSNISYVMAHLKGFDEERKLMVLHKTLVEECLDLNTKRKLAEFAADFEQTCASEGVTFEGERNKTLHNDLIVLLARDDLHINDKMRLVLIYGLYRGGLIEADFMKLVKFIGVNDRQIISLISRCFENLHKLGFPVIKKDVKDKKVVKKMFHTINNQGTYNTSRYGTAIKNLTQGLIKYNLDEEWFPYFRDKPLMEDLPPSAQNLNDSHSNNSNNSNQNGSLRNTRIKPVWAQSINASNSNSHSNNHYNHQPTKQRIFCYIAGGMTYSEIRSMYELSSSLNKDIYIGSESILKPRDFLIGLQSIDNAKSVMDLDLHLMKLKHKSSDPPNYLFEDGRPKPPQAPIPQPQPPQSQHFKTTTSSSSSSASPNPNSKVPSHYQKRSSSLSMNSSPEKKDKEKKTSRLKKLFK
ncbi:Sec1-like protein [Scheffersomyces coipomensis]|uniref:Sec1-like protein n=1 Tax=Scheffersomyces coipomensis TaxID=1788519 RepID=UPI00315CB96D